MLHLFAGTDLHTGLLLLLALAFVLFYEAINGFHDTANAVTNRDLYPQCVRNWRWSWLRCSTSLVFCWVVSARRMPSCICYQRICCLIWDRHIGLAMVFSMLLAAIIWNTGTVLWFTCIQLPTLIGAIIGIGLTNALMTGTLGGGRT